MQPRGGQVVDVTGRIPALAPIVAALDSLAARYGRLYLVGGGVRDVLIGVEVVDIDIAVEGAGIELAEALSERLGGRVTSHGEFGTATVAFDRGELDVATTRSEHYAHPGALPSVEHAPIERDLFRRDFTVNAMAIRLDLAERGRLIDPHGGEQDLATGTLRVLHERSFLDDPTRIFRAARYEARYGFALDPASEALARAAVSSGHLRSLSLTRVGGELVALLAEERGVAALARLETLGLMHELHPGLDAAPDTRAAMCRATELNDELGAGAADWRLRLALLVRGIEGGGGHDRARWLEALQLSRHDTDLITRAAEVAPHLAERSARATSNGDLYALLASEPVEAVVTALAEAPLAHRGAGSMRTFLTELRHVRVAIDGRDLARLGLPESPAVGRVLEGVLGLKLDGELATREEELDAARALIRDERVT